MTSLQVEYFLKVAENMSFSKAASALFVTQPAVSRQIKLLEEELGYPLFDRTQRNRLRLTAAGAIFCKSFSEAAAGLAGAKAAAARLPSGEIPRLRVGTGAGWELSEALTRFRRQVLSEYPHAELSFECSEFRVLREKLRSDELDVILCTKTSIPDFDGLEFVPVANLESRAYVRRGVLRPDDELLCLQDFHGQRLLMLHEDESPMAMELVLILFQAQQIRVDPVWMPNRESILQAVLMGEGFTVFDQHIYFRNDPRLIHCRLEDVIPICAVWKKPARSPLIPLFAAEMERSMRKQQADRGSRTS